MIVSAVTAAVEVSTKAVIEASRSSPSSEKVQQLALFAKYDNDRQEQYSRRERESVPISGLWGGDTENDIIQEITELGKKMDVDIKAEDISAAHRIGRPGSGQSGLRSVIWKFISRQTKD